MGSNPTCGTRHENGPCNAPRVDHTTRANAQSGKVMRSLLPSLRKDKGQVTHPYVGRVTCPLPYQESQIPCLTTGRGCAAFEHLLH